MLSAALVLSLAMLPGQPLPHRSARLIDASLLDFAGVALVAGAEPNLETMSHAELEMERTRLIDSRRSVAPGVVLLSAGGGVGLFFMLFALSAASVGEFEAMAVLLVIGGVGLAAAAVGVVLLVMALSANSAAAARIAEVDDRIRAMGGSSDQPPPPPNQPPPPPPQPGSARDVPPPGVLVATF